MGCNFKYFSNVFALSKSSRKPTNQQAGLTASLTIPQRKKKSQKWKMKCILNQVFINVYQIIDYIAYKLYIKIIKTLSLYKTLFQYIQKYFTYIFNTCLFALMVFTSSWYWVLLLQTKRYLIDSPPSNLKHTSPLRIRSRRTQFVLHEAVRRFVIPDPN